MDKMKHLLRKWCMYACMLTAPMAGFLFVRTMFAPPQPSAFSSRLQNLQAEVAAALQNIRAQKLVQPAAKPSPATTTVGPKVPQAPQTVVPAKPTQPVITSQPAPRNPAVQMPKTAPSVKPTQTGPIATIEKAAKPTPPIAKKPQIPARPASDKPSSIREFLDVSSDAEGIAKLQAVEQQYAKILTAIYFSLANAINSSQLQKTIEQVVQQGELAILDPEEIGKLNRMVYDKIFEWKTRQYEAIQQLKRSCEPVLLQAQKFINASDKQEKVKALSEMVRLATEKKIKLEDVPKEQIIREVQQMKLD